MRIPKKLRPKHSFRIPLCYGEKLFVRVHIHSNQKAFDAYMTHSNEKHESNSAAGIVRLPPYADYGNSWCLCEVNMHLNAHTVSTIAHELLHVAFFYLCWLGVRGVVPPKNFLSCKRTRSERKRYQSYIDNQEHACYAMGTLLGQYVGKCQKLGVFP